MSNAANAAQIYWIPAIAGLTGVEEHPE